MDGYPMFQILLLLITSDWNVKKVFSFFHSFFRMKFLSVFLRKDGLCLAVLFFSFLKL
jgi:hypothetical protein